MTDIKTDSKKSELGMESVRFDRISRFKIFKRLVSLFALIYFVVVTFKYLLSEESGYVDYLFTLEHLNITTFIVLAAMIIELAKTRYIVYDGEKICLYSRLVLRYEVCIKYEEIKVITDMLGMVSIRTTDKIIRLDNFFYRAKDIKNIFMFLQQKRSAELINPKMKPNERILMIIFLIILFVVTIPWVLIFILK